MLAPFGIGLAVYVMIGALTDPIERIGLFRVPLATAFARARGLPRSAWGTAVAHFAAGMLLFGVIAESQWNAERIVSLKPARASRCSGYDLTLDGLLPRQGPNYRELVASFTVRRDGDVIGVLEPSKRTFAQRSTSTTEAALLTRGASQLYLSLGDLGSRRRDRGAALSQAAGAADLDRRAGDGVRRRAVALRPPPARRRAQARAQVRAAAGGVGRCDRSRPSVALVPARDARARGAARRDPERSGARIARARAQPRAALHGLPEPVDRRLAMRRSRRTCACWCASA